MVNAFSDSWIRNHPGKTMSIYDIPSIVKEALPRVVTLKNISAGFECTGIFPFNRNIFTDADFAPSAVTDRPAPQTKENELDVTERVVSDGHSDPVNSTADVPVEEGLITVPSTNGAGPSGLLTSTSSSHPNFSPETIRPFPKADPRQNTRKGRKKRKSAILTDTPEKLAIEEEFKNRKAKQVRKNFNRKTSSVKVQKRTEETSSEDEDSYCLVCLELFRDSRPKEKWIQCWECKGWAHVARTFVCVITVNQSIIQVIKQIHFCLSALFVRVNVLYGSIYFRFELCAVFRH